MVNHAMSLQITASGLPIAFTPGDEATADLIAEAIAGTLARVQSDWGLDAPHDCRLYVMASWRGFLFEAAPAAWKVLLAVGYPLWSGRARRTWPYSAGWTLRFGRRIAIGIKPPRLLEASDRSIGEHMFVEEPDASAKIRHLTCHELTHAASSHLRLPPWLNEGLAAVSVDRFMGKQTIRQESLGLLERLQPKGPPPSYRAMSQLHGEELAYHAVRGYWIVRFLEEVFPGFVRTLLASRVPQPAIERRTAERLGEQPTKLWQEIDHLVVEHFHRQGATTSASG
jgi:hypothetical protein